MKNTYITAKIMSSPPFNRPDFKSETNLYSIGRNKYEDKLTRVLDYMIHESTVNIIYDNEVDPTSIVLYKIIDINTENNVVTYKKVRIFLNNKFFNKLLLKNITFNEYMQIIINNTKIERIDSYQILVDIIIGTGIMDTNFVYLLKDESINNIMNNL